MPRSRRERIAAPEFEPEPLPLELPLIDPTRLPSYHEDEDDSDAREPRRVIVIDLC